MSHDQLTKKKIDYERVRGQSFISLVAQIYSRKLIIVMCVCIYIDVICVQLMI